MSRLDRTYSNAQWSTLLQASRIAKDHCANPQTGHEPGSPGCGACQTADALHALAGKVPKVVDIDAKKWISTVIFEHLDKKIADAATSALHKDPDKAPAAVAAAVAECGPTWEECDALAEIILAGPCGLSAASEDTPASEANPRVEALHDRLSTAQARADALADRVCMLEHENGRAHIRIDGVCTDVVDAGREIDSLRRKVG